MIIVLNSNSQNKKRFFPEPPPTASVTEHSSVVARRIGFAAIPLACLVIRVFIQIFSTVDLITCPAVSTEIAGDNIQILIHTLLCWFRNTCFFISVFVLLLCAKCIVGLGLLRFSAIRYTEIRNRVLSYPVQSKRASVPEQPKSPSRSIPPINSHSLPTSPLHANTMKSPTTPKDASSMIIKRGLVRHTRLPRFGSDIIDTDLYGSEAHDRDVSNLSMTASTPEISKLHPRPTTMHIGDSDELVVQGKGKLRAENGGLEKEEDEFIGSIKVPHPEGAVSLDNIDRYTLFKSRIP